MRTSATPAAEAAGAEGSGLSIAASGSKGSVGAAAGAGRLLSRRKFATRKEQALQLLVGAGCCRVVVGRRWRSTHLAPGPPGRAPPHNETWGPAVEWTHHLRTTLPCPDLSTYKSLTCLALPCPVLPLTVAACLPAAKQPVQQTAGAAGAAAAGGSGCTAGPGNRSPSGRHSHLSAR